MKLSEMIAAIGDENVTIQRLDTSMAGVKVGKKDGRIEFYTSKDKAQQLANYAAGVGELAHTALIIWVPTNKLKEVCGQ